jgi:hypothetical protein
VTYEASPKPSQIYEVAGSPVSNYQSSPVQAYTDAALTIPYTGDLSKLVTGTNEQTLSYPSTPEVKVESPKYTT